MKAGYIAKKSIEELQSAGCRQLLIVSSLQSLLQEYDCLLKLSRCGLIISSVDLTQHAPAIKCFTLLDFDLTVNYRKKKLVKSFLL